MVLEESLNSGLARVKIVPDQAMLMSGEAFENIGWKFHLCFIIPTALFGISLWLFFPDTLGVPLEEIARIFGDHEDSYIQQQQQPQIVLRSGEDKQSVDEQEVIEVSHSA